MEGPYTSSLYTQAQATDTVWVLVSAGLIFFMQTGFVLIEYGAVRRKNSQSMLIKNLINTAVAILAFWLVGYGFGMAGVSQFIGNDSTYFASYNYEAVTPDHYQVWFIATAYAIVVSTIWQGALAERTQLVTYFFFTLILSSFIFPVVLAWTWGNGWLAQAGFHDFSGTAIVHIVGGVAGLCGAIIVGPRINRWKKLPDHLASEADAVLEAMSAPKDADFSKIAEKHFQARNDAYRRNSPVFIIIGCLIVWTTYIFYTGGRTLTQGSQRTNSSSKIIQNTLLASATSGLLSFALRPLLFCTHFNTLSARALKFDALTITNGILIGLVSISGAADRTQGWCAILIGAVAAFFYLTGVWLIDYLQIDDALETSVVHFGGGVWGLLAVGFFDNIQGALFINNHKQGQFFGYQLVGIVAITAWTAIISVLYFQTMKVFDLLRVDPAVEVVGMDIAELHGEVPESYLDAVRKQISDQHDFILQEKWKFHAVSCSEETAGHDDQHHH